MLPWHSSEPVLFVSISQVFKIDHHFMIIFAGGDPLKK
jgi:hypothetical protein